MLQEKLTPQPKKDFLDDEYSMKHENLPPKTLFTVEPKTNMDLFLGDLEYFPVFTAEEEFQHFTKLAQLKVEYARLTSSEVKPDMEDESETLLSQIKQEVIEIANHNIGLVINIAKHKFVNAKYKPEELVQEGYLGLERAIDKFDVSKGYKFSTYATYWIRQRIDNFYKLNQRAIRATTYAVDIQLKIDNIIEDYLKQTGNNPSEQQIQLELKKRHNCIVDEDKIAGFLNLPRKLTSLNSPVYSVSGEVIGELIDIVQSYEAPIESQLLTRELYAGLENIMQLMPERERLVLVYLYGLDGSEPKTAKQAALLLGISKSRITQLETKALDWVRSYLQSVNLMD